MKSFRKEDRIQQILAERGHRPGLVHIFSAMEPCPTYEPWHDKKTGCTVIRRDRGKCLHYYFYFIDEMRGLYFLSVPTWCPFPNNRYIDFLSTIDDPTPGLKALSKISEPVKERDHRYRGFNFFDDDDQTLFEVLCRGEFFIHGFRNRSLRHHLKQFRAQISRLLKRLRLHGIIKKVGNTYKYYLTQLGRHVAIAGLTLKNMFLVPEFATAIAY